jgi:hypothetical protein
MLGLPLLPDLDHGLLGCAELFARAVPGFLMCYCAWLLSSRNGWLRPVDAKFWSWELWLHTFCKPYWTLQVGWPRYLLQTSCVPQCFSRYATQGVDLLEAGAPAVSSCVVSTSALISAVCCCVSQGTIHGLLGGLLGINFAIKVCVAGLGNSVGCFAL